MTVSISVAEHGKGTGTILSMFYHEERKVFIVTVRHKIGIMGASTPVELEPGETAIVILSNIISGFLSEQEMKLLYNLALKTVDPIVEIGSFMGKSTVCLGWGARLGSGVPVYAVDPHRGSQEHERYLSGSLGTYPVFHLNMINAGLGGIVYPKRVTSQVAVNDFKDESLGLVFIDGDHSQSSLDFDLWAPKVKSGGFMAFHDSTGAWPMVEETVKTKLTGSWSIQEVVHTITVGRKT